MSGPLRQYIDRSLNKLRRDAVAVMKMDINPSTPPFTLYSFTSSLPPADGPNILAKGSDVDIGGLSTAHFTRVPTTSTSTFFPSSSASGSSSAVQSTTPPPASASAVGSQASTVPSSGGTTNGDASWSHVAFHGNMSLRVPPQYAGRIKSGYAGMRNRKRPTLFGEETWDLSLYSHLRITVAYRGWEGWRNRWYCNIQTDGPILTDLFQHRLELPPSPASTPSTKPYDPLSGPPPSFTTLHLPLSAFVLTNSGQTAEKQIEMLYSRIRSVGFSLLGGGRGDEGMPSTSALPAARDIQEMRRMASGGWGSTGKEDIDPEVEALLAEDGLLEQARAAQAAEAQKAQQAASPGSAAANVVGSQPTGGYHRVGDAAAKKSKSHVQSASDGSASVEQHGEDEDGGITVTPWSEGYYELCIKSVEAVNHDPMLADEDGPESADM